MTQIIYTRKDGDGLYRYLGNNMWQRLERRKFIFIKWYVSFQPFFDLNSNFCIKKINMFGYFVA